MTNRFLSIGFAAIALVFLVVTDSKAVDKVSRLINFVDFYVGSSQPIGERDGLPDFEFLINNSSVDIESEDIYDNSFHLGISYGQLRSSHFLWSAGLRYTKHNLGFDTLVIYQSSDSLVSDTAITTQGNPTYNQIDIDFNFNLYLTDPMKTSFAPYAGLGIKAGFIAIDDDINDADYSANLGMSLNFGADLKIWSSPDSRTFVTLSSVNSYDFYGSNDRPKYLNFGGGIKYYFRP